MNKNKDRKVVNTKQSLKVKILFCQSWIFLSQRLHVSNLRRPQDMAIIDTIFIIVENSQTQWLGTLLDKISNSSLGHLITVIQRQCFNVWEMLSKVIQSRVCDVRSCNAESPQFGAVGQQMLHAIICEVQLFSYKTL